MAVRARLELALGLPDELVLCVLDWADWQTVSAWSCASRTARRLAEMWACSQLRIRVGTPRALAAWLKMARKESIRWAAAWTDSNRFICRGHVYLWDKMRQLHRPKTATWLRRLHHSFMPPYCRVFYHDIAWGKQLWYMTGFDAHHHRQWAPLGLDLPGKAALLQHVHPTTVLAVLPRGVARIRIGDGDILYIREGAADFVPLRERHMYATLHVRDGRAVVGYHHVSTGHGEPPGGGGHWHAPQLVTVEGRWPSDTRIANPSLSARYSVALFSEQLAAVVKVTRRGSGPQIHLPV